MLASGLIFIAALQLEWIKRKSAEKFNEEKQANKTKQNKENLLTLILTLIVSDNSHAYDACFISLIILYLVLLLVST